MAKQQSEREILKIARKRYERAITAEAKNRSEALDDLKFKNNDQWDESARARRLAERRPCLTVNKMKTFVHQITNEQRQNRPSISVSPVGDKGDKHTASVLRGLIREIERHSDADIAYDTGFDNAVSNGFGYWRVVTEQEDPLSKDQVIKVLRIRNPFTVYLDPERHQPDGSDAMWGFVTELIPREEFKMLYPKADPISWDTHGMGEDTRYWTDQSNVRVAEYFTVDLEIKDVVELANGHVGYKSDLSEKIQARLNEEGFVLDQWEAEVRTITWRKITCREILEEGEWPGKWIPIIECVGDEIDIEGKVTRAGIIRDAKDAQRMKNFWASAMTERVALETKSPWVMAEGQVEGHEEEWRNSNLQARPYLTYKPTDISGKLVPPPQRQSWMGPPAGVMAAEAQSEQDMMTTTGVRFDATKSERIQDESGVALQQLRSNQQLGAYHYIDNLSHSLKHTGRIMIDLIPHIYDTKRILTIINEDGKDERVQVNPQQQAAYDEIQNDEGKLKSFNPNVGKYEVAVTIGPNYQTRMQEAADSMMNFAKAFPNAAQFIADLVAKNQIWPESDLIERRIQMTLPPEMLLPEQKDMTPQTQAYIISLQKQIQTLHQQSQQMAQALTDKKTDQALDKEKIDRDFEAKMVSAVLKAVSEQNRIMQQDLAAKLQVASNEFTTILNHVREVENANTEARAKEASAAKGNGASQGPSQEEGGS